MLWLQTLSIENADYNMDIHEDLQCFFYETIKHFDKK